MSKGVKEYIQALMQSPDFRSRVRYHQVIDERQAAYAAPEKAWPEDINGILKKSHIAGLFRHQAAAVDLIRAGIHTVVATPTASGKSIIYNLPALERIISTPSAKALYIFPLKALAQDQLRTFTKISDMCTTVHPTAAIYDGDTTPWFRKKIRENPPNVIMTNPEMIHLSFLPYHRKWAPFWSDLQVVAVDEVHTYRGIMGSHMANVFRRLLRICRHYDAAPVFSFTSATVANPAQLARELTGLEVTTIDQNAAPSGRRHVVFINDTDNSPAHCAIQLLKAALPRQLRTIVYTQSRKMAELISIWAQNGAGKYAGRISAYRAGFLPEERRRIEARLASGELLAVISTSALELGIDIGDLDLCILVGYPGTIVSTWQRGGRVGRSGQESALILVAGEDALDQYFMNNPEDFFSRRPESAILNPHQPGVLEKHMVCAAAELPWKAEEIGGSPAPFRVAAERLVSSGALIKDRSGEVYYSSQKYPHRHVDLRGAGRRLQIKSLPTGEIIGEIDHNRAQREVHPGAVYIHMGQTYRIESYLPEAGLIEAIPRKSTYYTQIKAFSEIEILEIAEEKKVFGTMCYRGRVKVTDQVLGFYQKQVRTGKRLQYVALDLPPLTFETQGVWFTIDANYHRKTENSDYDFMGTIHAAEHAVIGIFPLLVMADRNDLGGVSTPYHPQMSAAAVFIYDGIEGGAGLCYAAYDRAGELMTTALNAIIRCPCDNGCPSCVQSPKCGNGNRPMDKNGAGFLLRQMTGDTNFKPALRIAIEAPVIKSDTALPERKSSPTRFGVFDIETQRSAADVGGWHRAQFMKISCVVLYDSIDGNYYEFVDGQIQQFIDHLQQLDLVVGFNIKRFDYRVLSGYSDYPFTELPTLDLLESVSGQLGYRLSLDHLGKWTLGVGKTADGLAALRWWKEGKIGKILEYCRHDVTITRDLYMHGKAHGYLLYRDKTGQDLQVPVSW
ncbi:MAG: DEAD/DEAH box helicase [Desulfobacteraceae bacterium]|nr:DEAD/DEAH box helicase [Desulfobacteraceae bacterium]